MQYALTYHVEGERDQPSGEILREIGAQVELADRLGFDAAWFAEHHGHAHIGHLPHPLQFALYLAGRTARIHLGSAVICINLHHPVLIAEQIATADVLSGGRMSIGVGSGSTPAEFAIFGVAEMQPDARRARFVEILDVLEAAWTGQPIDFHGQTLRIQTPGLLPRPERDMRLGLWIGANSLDSAFIAGERGYGLQLSNLRTIPELRELIRSYRDGRASTARLIGPERIAASAPLYCAPIDERALAEFQPALDHLLRENRRARPAASDPAARPQTPREHLVALRFTVGSPDRCVAELLALREQLDFTTLNLRPRWIGTTAPQVEASIRLFAEAVRPRLDRAWSNDGADAARTLR